MGTWGYSVFSSDLGSDIRGEFREMIGDGLTPEQATHRLRSEYKENGALLEPEDRPVFWLALAAAQWESGRLLEDVKCRALDEIDSGRALKPWREAGPAAMKKRKAALTLFRKKLLSPQPEPKRIRKVFHERTPWDVGHAVSYRLLSGHHVVMRVIDISEQRKSRIAIVDLCDSTGQQLPDVKSIAKLPRKHTRHFAEIMKAVASETAEARRWHEDSDGKFAVYSLKRGEYPADRLDVIATRLKFRKAGTAGESYYGSWTDFDDYLRREFDLA